VLSLDSVHPAFRHRAALTTNKIKKMCLPGLCPGDSFDRFGANLDTKIAALAERISGSGETVQKLPPPQPQQSS